MADEVVAVVLKEGSFDRLAKAITCGDGSEELARILQEIWDDHQAEQQGTVGDVQTGAIAQVVDPSDGKSV